MLLRSIWESHCTKSVKKWDQERTNGSWRETFFPSQFICNFLEFEQLFVIKQKIKFLFSYEFSFPSSSLMFLLTWRKSSCNPWVIRTFWHPAMWGVLRGVRVRIWSGIVACAKLIGRGEERASIFAYILYPVSVLEQCEIVKLGSYFWWVCSLGESKASVQVQWQALQCKRGHHKIHQQPILRVFHIALKKCIKEKLLHRLIKLFKVLLN